MGMLKNKFFRKSPDWLFVPLAKLYYAFLPNKEKLTIEKIDDRWLVGKGNLKLFSPSPKLLVSFKRFEAKFERYLKIKKGDVMLDVGACVGDTTVPMAIKTGVEGLVIAVEPHPVNVEFLRLNLKDFYNAEIIQKAVWNKSGTIKFNVSWFPMGHSIVDESDNYIEVECDILDSIVGDRIIDFAKIDVQGAEVQVLEGATKLLETTRKVIVETHYRYDENKRTYPQVIRMLRKAGYETRLSSDGVVHAWK